MTGPDAALSLRLLTAHVLADFYLQPDSWVKERPEDPLGRGTLFHCGVQAILTWLLSFRLASLWIIPFVFFTHLLIDVGKVWAEERGENVSESPRCWAWFVLDQFLHGIVLVLVWVWLTSTVSLGNVFGFVLSPGPLVILAATLVGVGLSMLLAAVKAGPA